MVLVDAGDALARTWPSAQPESERASVQQQAAFLLSQMGAQGYAALAVGERELVFPVPELVRRAAAARLPLLAANLADPQGKKPFPGHVMAVAGGRKVGIFAVVDGAEYERHQLRCLDAAAAAQAEADSLRKAGAEVVVGLLHLPYDAALKLLSSLKGVDYAIQAHDGRPVMVQQVGTALLAGAGQRGQVVGRAELSLSGSGAFFLVEDNADRRAALEDRQENVQQLESRIRAAASDEEKARLGMALVAARKRLDQAKALADARPPPGRRTAATDHVSLNSRIADDPKVKAAQEAALKPPAEKKP